MNETCTKCSCEGKSKKQLRKSKKQRKSKGIYSINMYTQT